MRRLGHRRIHSARNVSGGTLEVENVFKIATSDGRVRELLAKNGWVSIGKDKEMEMDSFRNDETGRRLCIEDISDDFPVTFLMGELSQEEFGRIAHNLTPGIKLMEVDSRWEGKSTTIVVAMTEEQIRKMFGKRVKMRQV